MPTPSLDAHFGKEYRIAWDRAHELAMITYGTQAEVAEKVSEYVHDISDALAEKDVHICLLALTHVVREHFLLPMSGR
jgi:hypothetical protein